MRYIEIDSIIEQIKAEHCERCTNHRCALCDIDEVLILLEEADDADVEEVKHGEWIYHECVSSHEGAISGYSCSECCSFVDEEIFDADGFHENFCGHCGAKMDEEGKEK